MLTASSRCPPCPHTAGRSRSRCTRIRTRDCRARGARDLAPWTLPFEEEEHSSFSMENLFPSPEQWCWGTEETQSDVGKRQSSLVCRMRGERAACRASLLLRVFLRVFCITFYFTPSARSTRVLLSEEKMWVRIEMSPGLSATFIIAATVSTSAENPNQILHAHWINKSSTVLSFKMRFSALVKGVSAWCAGRQDLVGTGPSLETAHRSCGRSFLQSGTTLTWQLGPTSARAGRGK